MSFYDYYYSLYVVLTLKNIVAANFGVSTCRPTTLKRQEIPSTVGLDLTNHN
jgi:hypothetical protein